MGTPSFDRRSSFSGGGAQLAVAVSRAASRCETQVATSCCLAGMATRRARGKLHSAGLGCLPERRRLDLGRAGGGKVLPPAQGQGRPAHRSLADPGTARTRVRACIGRTRARRAIRRLTARGGRSSAGRPAAASRRLSRPLGTPARPGWGVRRSSPDPGSSAHRSPACSRRTSPLACRQIQRCLVWKRSHTRRARWRRRRALRGGVRAASRAPLYAAAHNTAVTPHHQLPRALPRAREQPRRHPALAQARESEAVPIQHESSRHPPQLPGARRDRHRTQAVTNPPTLSGPREQECGSRLADSPALAPRHERNSRLPPRARRSQAPCSPREAGTAA